MLILRLIISMISILIIIGVLIAKEEIRAKQEKHEELPGGKASFYDYFDKNVELVLLVNIDDLKSQVQQNTEDIQFIYEKLETVPNTPITSQEINELE